MQENDEMKKRHEMWELQQMQELPLDMKIKLTQSRIRQWVNEFGEDGVYISFSGGKDSTVLLDIVRKMYPSIKAVYVDTGLEYPEIKHFVKGFDNVEIIRPEMVFKDVIVKYGYPMISKEVSECVQGARKYLTSILDENTIARQTDRQTDSIAIPTFMTSSRDKGNTQKEIIPSVDEESLKKLSRGGYDNKYRKLRGIGEYTQRTNADTAGWVKSEARDNAGVADKRQRTSDSGEYP